MTKYDIPLILITIQIVVAEQCERRDAYGRPIYVNCGNQDCCGDKCCSRRSVWSVWYLWFTIAMMLLLFVSLVYLCWRHKRAQRMSRVVAVTNSGQIIYANTTRGAQYGHLMNQNGFPVYMVPPPSYRMLLDIRHHQDPPPLSPGQPSHTEAGQTPDANANVPPPSYNRTLAPIDEERVMSSSVPPAYDTQRQDLEQRPLTVASTAPRPPTTDTIAEQPGSVPEGTGDMTIVSLPGDSPDSPPASHRVVLPPLDFSELLTERAGST